MKSECVKRELPKVKWKKIKRYRKKRRQKRAGNKKKE